MIINIAVCDDEKDSLENIQKELFQLANTLNITIETYLYTDGNKVVNLIYNNKEDFDILFLDIDMPNISGLEVAKKLREKGSDIILIFISAHEQYVFESIEYSPFRYIRKNKISEELPLAMKAAFTRLENEKDRNIIIKTDDGEVRLYHSEIMYYEIEDRRLNIHLSDGTNLLTWKTIKELLKEMNDENL